MGEEMWESFKDEKSIKTDGQSNSRLPREPLSHSYWIRRSGENHEMHFTKAFPLAWQCHDGPEYLRGHTPSNADQRWYHPPSE